MQPAHPSVDCALMRHLAEAVFVTALLAATAAGAQTATTDSTATGTSAATSPSGSSGLSTSTTAGLAPAGCVLPLLQQAARDVEQLLRRAQAASMHVRICHSIPEARIRTC